MASEELMNRWNRQDEEGSIQPPLTPDEVDALAREGVDPETPLTYGDRDPIDARRAFIACDQFRAPGNPILTALAVAACK